MRRRRIEIVNETRWRTDDLRALIRRACADVFDPGTKPLVRVRVVYAGRKRYVTGCAFLGGTSMTLRIGSAVGDVRDVGATIVHELGHLRGLDHGAMRGGLKWTWKGVPERDGVRPYEQWLRAHEWAAAFPLRVREEEKKTRVTGVALVERELERSRSSLKRWESKAKRAATAIRKVRSRIRYYERRAAALGQGGTE